MSQNTAIYATAYVLNIFLFNLIFITSPCFTGGTWTIGDLLSFIFWGICKILYPRKFWYLANHPQKISTNKVLVLRLNYETADFLLHRHSGVTSLSATCCCGCCCCCCLLLFLLFRTPKLCWLYNFLKWIPIYYAL